MKREEIHTYINTNPGISSVDIAKSFGISRIAVYKHLQTLLKEKKIFTHGQGKSTRYFPIVHSSYQLPPEFYKNIYQHINEEYDGISETNIPSLVDHLCSYLKADGEWRYGIDAFRERMTKENHNKTPSVELLQQRLIDFLLCFLEEERKRRKNGFFDGTKSLEYILGSYKMPSSVDRLLFTQISTLPHFGRVRGANEIYWGKKDQSEALLRAGITRGIETIQSYILKNNIRYSIYTPPTVKRKVQFRGILKKLLKEKNIILQEISCSKVKNPTLTLKPQKDTKGRDRIINARSSMILQDITPYLNIPEIVIFDDNFTTGATVNAIAEMMRKQGYTNTITVITLTGNFEYIPGVTDEGDI